jgi:hypothetical protein
MEWSGMSKDNRWIFKSLALGASLALVIFVLFFGFLTIHTESGVARASSYKLATLAFFLGTIAAVIYFRFRSDRLGQ